MDRREFKALAQAMSKALRDSEGGGIMERFEDVSKMLFVKMLDEQEVDGLRGPSKGAPDVCWRDGDNERTVYERCRAVWHRGINGQGSIFRNGRGAFPRDVRAVAEMAALLSPYRLTSTPVDVKGAVYEELLRDTFEKNENQQYFTPRVITEFMVQLAQPSAGDRICDPACGSGGFLVAALNALPMGDLRPEVVGAEVDERMAWVARINMILHGGLPTAIAHLRGAGSLGRWADVGPSLDRDSFNLILTNPPFGSDLTDRRALAGFRTGRGRNSRRRGVLFVERCIDLLAPDGRLVIVVDDSVLNSSSNRDLRQIIRQETVVEAVISLPDVTFMPYSTAKCSILVLRKRGPAHRTQGPVFMADVSEVGIRPNGDALYAEERDENGMPVLLSDLPEVLESWVSYTTRGADAPLSGRVYVVDIDDYSDEPDGDRLDAFYFHPTRREAHALLERSRHPVVSVGEAFEVANDAVIPEAVEGDASIEWLGLGDIESRTGTYVISHLPASRIRSAAHVFESGDILFSKLRPLLRKTIFISEEDVHGYCSAELLVLRLRPEMQARVSAKYIAYLLRSDLALGQLIFRVTGIGRPRVSTSAVLGVRLPLPDLSEQEAIVSTLEGAEEIWRERRAAARNALEAAEEGRVESIAKAVDSLTSH